MQTLWVCRTDVKWNNTQVVTTPMQVPSVEKVPIFHSLQMGSKASGEKIQGEGIQIGQYFSKLRYFHL